MKQNVLWACCAVGFGGFLGSVIRYLISTIDHTFTFPFHTFLTNICGAFLIGMIFELSSQLPGISNNLILFAKTGFCGGFTTFSTFSLESCALIENKEYLTAGTYIFSSVAVCIFGVFLGRFVIRWLCTATKYLFA